MDDLFGLTWQFFLGLGAGVWTGYGVAAARPLWSPQGAERAVEIIRRIVAKEMSGPGVKDTAARLAAQVFIAGIEADARIRGQTTGGRR